MTRTLKFSHALREATDICMGRDSSVYVIGLGVPDAKGVFETTLGLQDKYGVARVMDMPAAENGITGIAIGSSLVGMRPVICHQRLDFAILAMDQMVNQAAKWRYMFGGQGYVPIVVRLIVGRGWGQGAQHSQSLQAWFAHIPGLKVIMPATPHDAKGMLIAAIEDNNPVISIEHRWLFGIDGPVPEGHYTVPLGKARVIRPGHDVTVVADSHMTIEALRAAEELAAEGVEVEVLDLRTLRPLDHEAVLQSVRRTGRLVVADTGWKACGVTAEIVAIVAEHALTSMKAPPVRVAQADVPSPASASLARLFFPGSNDVYNAVRKTLGRPERSLPPFPTNPPDDVPNLRFTGPF